MTKRISLLSLCTVICFAVAIVVPASAQTLYENGPINGETDAWIVNLGFVTADSFTISSGSSTLTGVSFGAWIIPGDVVESAGIEITSEPLGGTIYYDQQVNVTQSGCYLNQYSYNVCTETGSFNGPTLGNGTYWLDLQNVVTNNGEDPVYWDENGGIGCHSQGCPSQACFGNCEGTIPSEAFTILGTTETGSVPEPGSLLLFSGGVLGVVGFVRRNRL